ncbi:BMA-DDP-1 [Dirofilaria immitis]|nr:BMA-DDP-1 [Dirofilaria immitis]
MVTTDCHFQYRYPQEFKGFNATPRPLRHTLQSCKKYFLLTQQLIYVTLINLVCLPVGFGVEGRCLEPCHSYCLVVFPERKIEEAGIRNGYQFKNPSIVSTDPNWNLFLHQLQAENQRQKFTEQIIYDNNNNNNNNNNYEEYRLIIFQVQTLTGRCWDVCFSDYRPPTTEESRTHATLHRACSNSELAEEDL